MGQLFDRLRDFARTHLNTSDADLFRAERTISSDDDELRQIIEELHQEYTQNGRAQSQNGTNTRAKSTGPTSLPAIVIDAHRCLNVAVGATPEQIKRAYRSLIATWHPDRFASAPAKEQQHAHTRAHEINSAYVILREHYEFR